MTIAGLAYIIFRLDWLFILLVAATLALKAVFVRLQYSYSRRRRLMYAQNDRLGNYLTDLCYFNDGAAKEIRLNNIQDWLMGKIKGYRSEMVAMQLEDYRLYTAFEMITAVIMALQSFAILWSLSARYIGGAISIADFTIYFSAVIAITASLSRITEQIGDYNRQVLNVSDYRKLVDLRNSEHSPPNTAGASDVLAKTEFVFKNVSFSYPNTDLTVLNDINITITDKEKLVIVGHNGAGKTTFIKLLCKFYRPTRGQILFNGTDIWDIPDDIYRKVIAAVFQDFANFAFPLVENVSMGQEADMDKVRRVIHEVGLDRFTGELPNGLDTYISKQFDAGGVELSGGQGQKLAIARALYRNTPVLILDEPTASLDPKAESEIYENFFRAAREKTTIFISHRLAASTIADKIAVFCSGRIIEYGSHAALMEQNGVYAEMFRKQSSPYIDTQEG
jgi:ABC-type multidrug transport system fused ATPase/permease subunit